MQEPRKEKFGFDSKSKNESTNELILIMLFTTTGKVMLNIWREPVWYGDGTFKCVPTSSIYC